MIFVVLGVIILIVSFFIALVSLIREQDKIESLPNEVDLSVREDGEAVKEDNLPIVHEPPKKVPSEKAMKVDQESKAPTTTEAVPYPWQQDLQGGQIVFSLKDKEKIDKIRTDIANLTIRKKLQDQSRMILPDISGEVQEEDLDKKLSGEFSLDRYRR